MILDSKKVKLKEIRKSLRDNEIIIFPSDGTYLIGCSIDNKGGIEKIKDFGLNFIIPVSKQWITRNFKSKKNYMKEIPGPFIYVFNAKKKNKVEYEIGIAIPKHEITKKIQKSGEIMFVSALGVRNLRNVNRKIRKTAHLILDGGFLEGNTFTIIDLREKLAKIVR